jgi:hypothetical protein
MAKTYTVTNKSSTTSYTFHIGDALDHEGGWRPQHVTMGPGETRQLPLEDAVVRALIIQGLRVSPDDLPPLSQFRALRKGFRGVRVIDEENNKVRVPPRRFMSRN